MTRKAIFWAATAMPVCSGTSAQLRGNATAREDGLPIRTPDDSAQLSAPGTRNEGNRITAAKGAFCAISRSPADLAKAAKSLGAARDLQASQIAFIDAAETLRALEL